jgi:glyoxylase-like metal-dependent hydrolase (beta-lactamase superfamily II)
LSRRHSTISGFVTGDYLSPPGGRLAGQRVVAVAYLVRHPEATLLFDTGFPFDREFAVDEGDAHLVTYPRSVSAELAVLGSGFADLDLVANCHLHIDHAGGNFRLPPDLPIHVQATELAEAREETDPLVVDALALDRQAYRPVEGEHELLPGLRLLPTPGHTAGHQSLVVETASGPVVLLGQGVPSASEFSAAAYAVRLEAEGSTRVPAYPEWLLAILDLGPSQVLFAHDLASWQPAS